MQRPFIKAPDKIPLFLKWGLWISKRETGKDLLPGKLLTWVPKAALGAGVMEFLTAKGNNSKEKRLLNLVRIQASLTCSCAFCIDMNAAGIDRNGITEVEMDALQGIVAKESVSTFDQRELLAIEYAERISQTPLIFPESFIAQLKAVFSEKEIVLLASTIASVNYWARLTQGLGIPAAGFTEKCYLRQEYIQEHSKENL